VEAEQPDATSATGRAPGIVSVVTVKEQKQFMRVLMVIKTVTSM
jgi:hypothetical protein